MQSDWRGERADLLVSVSFFEVLLVEKEERDARSQFGFDPIPDRVRVCANLGTEDSQATLAPLRDLGGFQELNHDLVPNLGVCRGLVKTFALAEHEVAVTASKKIDIPLRAAEFVLDPREPEETVVGDIAEEPSCKSDRDDPLLDGVFHCPVKGVTHRYSCRKTDPVATVRTYNSSLNVESRNEVPLITSTARADLPVSRENCSVCPVLEQGLEFEILWG